MKKLAAGLFCLIIASPIFSLFYSASNFTFNIEGKTVFLATYETGILILGTVFIASLLSIPIAALLVFTDIKYKRVIFILSCLPLALPPYLTAFCWSEMADGLGIIQTVFREITGYKLRRDYRFPEIRSLGGAIFIFSISLYPYLFLSGYIAFIRQGRKLTDAALTLGATPIQAFRRIVLKLIKPTVIAGSLPLIFETLNDIAVAKVTGIITLPLYIMNQWLEKNNTPFAALMSLILIGLIAFFIYKITLDLPKKQKNNTIHAPLFKLNNKIKIPANLLVLIPSFLGFILPISYLLFLASKTNLSILPISAIITTIKISILTTTLSLMLSLTLYLIVRNYPKLTSVTITASLGYAIPGSILALAIMPVLINMGNLMNIPLMGTIAGLIIALSIRFITLSYEQINAISNQSKHLVFAARTLGASPIKAFYAIEWPRLKPTIMLTALLVLVETAKELPLSLMLRPIGIETISIRLFEKSEAGALNEMALPALILVLICAIPVTFLIKKTYTNHV